MTEISALISWDCIDSELRGPDWCWGLGTCSSAVWDTTPGQRVTKGWFHAVTQMTPARSKILLQACVVSASTNLYNNRAAGKLLFPRRWDGTIWPLIMKPQLGAVFCLKTSGIHHQAPTFCPITSYMQSVVRSHFLLFIEELNVLLKVILPISGCWCIWDEITRETTICCVQICSKNTQWLNHGSIFHAEVALWHLIIHIYWPVCSWAGAKTLSNPQSHRSELLVCNMSLERDITQKAAETISSLCGVTNLLINAVLSDQQFPKFIIIPVSCTLFVIFLPPFPSLCSDRRTRHTLSVSAFT